MWIFIGQRWYQWWILCFILLDFWRVGYDIVQGSVNVPFLGGFWTSLYISVGNYIFQSWVIFNWDIYQPLFFYGSKAETNPPPPDVFADLQLWAMSKTPETNNLTEPLSWMRWMCIFHLEKMPRDLRGLKGLDVAHQNGDSGFRIAWNAPSVKKFGVPVGHLLRAMIRGWSQSRLPYFATEYFTPIQKSVQCLQWVLLIESLWYSNL